jgi:hypothetical protein
MGTITKQLGGLVMLSFCGLGWLNAALAAPPMNQKPAVHEALHAPLDLRAPATSAALDSHAAAPGSQTTFAAFPTASKRQLFGAQDSSPLTGQGWSDSRLNSAGQQTRIPVSRNSRGECTKRACRSRGCGRIRLR